MKPFRFGVMSGTVSSRGEWVEQVKAIEDAGCSTVFASDHFSGKPAPLPALAVAAEVSSLKIGTLVLANDFRHPAVVAKEAATVDLLSEGRLELGIGTGWALDDYNAVGIERSRPGVQVDRFEEAVAVMKGLWSEAMLDVHGDHYSVHLDGEPKPGDGRPSLLIGGGARRMLGIAGREADIVGISAAEISDHDSLAKGVAGAGSVMDAKIAWIKDGAGDRFDDLEINMLLFGVAPDPDGLAAQWGTTPERILDSPHFLVGSSATIADTLRQRREQWSISYPVIPFSALAAMRGIVVELTGT